VYVFAAFWQGATTKQATSCQEEQRRQGAAKACNHARSALTQKMKGQKVVTFKLIKCILTEISGQLRILGSSITSLITPR